MRTKVKETAILIFCILYVIFPFDLLPDFIPVGGWIDDLAAIYAGYRQVRAMAQNKAMTHDEKYPRDVSRTRFATTQQRGDQDGQTTARACGDIGHGPTDLHRIRHRP